MTSYGTYDRQTRKTKRARELYARHTPPKSDEVAGAAAVVDDAAAGAGEIDIAKS